MGKEINQSIVIDAKVRATLEGMNEVVSKLNKGLREGNAKIDLTKGIGNTISKQIDTFKTEYQKFTQLTKNNKLEFGDSKEAIRSGEQMVKTFSELKRIVGNFEDLTILDAKKMFPDAFDSRIDALGKRLTSLRNSLADLDSKKIEFDSAQTALDELRTKSDLLEKALNAEMAVKIDTDAAEQELDNAKKKVQELREELKKDLGAKLNATDATKISLEARKKEILEARSARGVTAEPLSGAQVKAAGGSKEAQAAASQALKIYNVEKNELREIEEALKKNSTEASKYRKALTGADSSKLTDLADKAESSAGKIQEITNALERQEQAEKDLSDVQDKKATQERNIAAIQKNLNDNTKAIETQEQKVNKLRIAYESLKSKINPDELTKAFKEIGIDFTPEMAKNEESVRQLQEELNKLDEIDHQKLIQTLQKMGISADSTEDYVRQLKGELSGIKDTAADISASAREMDNLKNQVLQFFSLTNSVQLFKRAVTSALNTVKELDKTMTEAAVVTEFDVGDMWDKLPQYSAEAQELGVSINGMYQATTLYYQQGLKTNEAMALGIETMKMGKIAAMDSTEATKAMTAALRGFNMELNETSATRVNDVYSQLAAVTAADTNQIATAMEKTASIAAAANMEFETTAAFLAQIIETTQEAPETAGTALKTIIARFSEVKSLRDQGLSSGKDSEGEGIDVNKIQTALKTVGISMEGFFAGTEGLDSILLKLAEKWDGLDFETQRYIATMAAGSRQQSRFIAMMSDYARTSELVTEAQNSAGASQEQFNKTLESMDSKLQRLENAWNQFLMGLANNEVLKGAVDSLTSIVEVLNKTTEALSGGNGLIKAVASLATVLSALKIGKSLIGGTALGENISGIIRKIGLDGKDGESFASKLGKKFVPVEGVQIKAGASKWEEFQAHKEAKKAEIKEARKNKRMVPFKDRMINKYKKAEYNETDKIFLQNRMSETSFEGDEIKTKQLEALRKELEEGKITTEDAAQQFKQLGGDIEGLGQKSAKSATDFGAVSSSLGKMGAAAMGIGAALGLLSSLFESLGMEEHAEATQTLAAVFMGLGTVLSVVSGILPVVTALTTAQAAATWAALGPLFIIVAVIGVLIAALLVFASNTKTAAEEMAELDSQMDALADAAKNAEDAMQNLADTQKDLANLKNTMDGLIKGTDEWNKALIESNNKVLELLDTYPELAEQIIEEDGLLKIKSEGWNLIAKKQMEAYTNASAARWALSAKKTEIAGRMIDEDKDMTVEEKIARNKALEIQGDIQVEEFYRQVAAANPNLKGNEFSEYSTTALAAEGLDNFVEALDKAAASIRINEQAYQEYADMMGITLEEAKEADEETIKNALAASRIQKQSANEIKIMNQKIAKETPEKQELIKALLSQDGSKITEEQANKFGEEGELAEFVETIGMTGEQIEGLWHTIQEVQNSFDILDGKIESLKIEGVLKGLLPNANFQIYSGIISKIAELQASNADPAQINEWFNQLLTNKTEEQKTAILEALAVTDWNSIEDLNNTFSTFAKDGLIDPAIANELNSEMKELAGAVSDNTVAQNQQKGFQLKDIMDQVLSGELTNVMSTDQKDALVYSGAFTEDEFQNVGTDEWVFNGDIYSRVVNLYGEINDKTKGQTGNAVEEYNRGENFTQTVKALDSQKFITYYDKNSKFSNFEQANAFGIGQMGKEWTGYVGFQTSQNKNANLGYEDWKEKNQSQFKKLTEDQLKEQYLSYMNSLLGANQFSGYAMFSIDDAIGEMKGGMTPTRASLNNIGGSLANALGVDWQKLTEGKTDEEIKQLILDWYDKYYDNPELKAAVQQSIINQANGIGSTTETTAARGYADTTGFTEEQKNQYQENYKKGIETRYTLYGGEAFMDQLTEGMTPEEIKKYDTVIKALASDLGQVAKKTKTFAENMINLSENLNESKRGTVEYSEALDQAYANIGALFGKDANWAKDLNISKEIIEGVAKGDKKSFNQMVDFIKESAQKGINEINWGENVDASIVSEKLANIQAFVDVQPGEEGYAEMLAFFQSLSEDGRKEFAWLASLSGVSLSFEYDKDGKITSVMGGASNLGDLFGNYAGGGGGGGGSKYENKYDKLHNELEEINDLLRERERLERRYQNLVNRGVESYKDIAEANQDRVNNLQEEIEKQRYIQEQRGKQIEENIAENPKMEKYIYFETNENGERSIRINWEEINKVKDSELGEKIDKFYEQNKEWIDSFNDAADAIMEGEDALYDAMQEGKDEYLDFENRVKEAIEKQGQDEIDKLSEVNDSINDTNSKIIESMQEQISAARQERDNAKTEQEIEDKQRRLAYLQQDTSGANALEIMQLQKEIDEQTEDYTDTLIDQKISELQKQNDQAAEQRQRQIDLAQAQLDQYVKSGEIWGEVNRVISEGFNEDGTIKVDSALYSLLQNAEGYQELSEIGQMNWLKGLETTVAQGLAWREGSGVLSTFWNKKQIEFTTADGEKVTGTVQEDGTVIDAQGNVYKDVSWEGGNVFKTNETKKTKQEQEEEKEENKKEEEKKPTGYWKEYYTWGKRKGTRAEIEAIIDRGVEDEIRELDQEYSNMSPSEIQIYEEINGSYWEQVERITERGKQNKESLTPVREWVAYKTGGLADFTGPAWLDGTKSRPEYILNADQTKAFFTLVDVLSGLTSSSQKSTEKTGDNTYDIDINVESIGSDYDVEQLANTIKRLINEDARYRNNNAINLMR